MIEIEDYVKSIIVSIIEEGRVPGIDVGNVFTSFQSVTEFLGSPRVFVITDSTSPVIGFGMEGFRSSVVGVYVLNNTKDGTGSVYNELVNELERRFDTDAIITNWIEEEYQSLPLGDGSLLYQYGVRYNLEYFNG